MNSLSRLLAQLVEALRQRNLAKLGELFNHEDFLKLMALLEEYLPTNLANNNTRRHRESLYRNIAEQLANHFTLTEDDVYEWVRARANDVNDPTDDNRVQVLRIQKALENQRIVVRVKYKKNGTEYTEKSEAFVSNNQSKTVQVLSTQRNVDLDHIPGPARAAIASGSNEASITLFD